MFLSRLPLRLIIAVAAGIVASKALDILIHWLLHLANVLPPLSQPNFSTRDQAVILSFHSLCTILSAFLTAMIAREKAKKATFILGTKEAVFWLIGMILLWNHSPFWVNMAKAVLGPPLCWMGGKMYEHLKR
jgi:cyanate permease